jgi:hypothetical protein
MNIITWNFRTLGGNWGRKLYISRVAGYNTPIWDVLALQGEQEEAGEHLYSAKLINSFPIRQAVPDGLAQASFCCWAQFFIVKKVYISRYNTLISILPFSGSKGSQEWVDAFG